MAEDTTAYVIPLHQVPLAKRRKSKAAAGHLRAQRGIDEDGAAAKPRRKTSRAKPKARGAEAKDADFRAVELKAAEMLGAESPSSPDSASRDPAAEGLIPAEFLPTVFAADDTDVAPAGAILSDKDRTFAPSRRHLAPALLSLAALVLALVGITINGWFARSLGASDIAGWLFLAVGVAADLVALVMPSCAAGLWQAGHRATAAVGWGIWLMTFVFAVTAGIGFASTNISEVKLARASRMTPAVMDAQAALTDAMMARDRECKSGVGKFCREREAAVAGRRQMLDSAMTSVGQTADPQTDAAIKLVNWVSAGWLRPAADDFAMLRLVLLALLPQVGGILLLVGRRV